MRKIYIITGAGGFLGNNIVRQLIETQPTAEIRALVSSPQRAEALTGLNCQIYAGDITKPETLNEIFTIPPDTSPKAPGSAHFHSPEVYVIHCAAVVDIKSKPNPALYQVNVQGTRNVAERVLELGAKLIYVNSVHALTEKPNNGLITEQSHFYPDQVEGQYAKSKAEAANLILDLVQRRGLDACIVQPSGIIGPYDFKTTHLTQLIIDAATGRLKAGVKGGYDFVDVRDVAQGILAACSLENSGQSYILSGHYASVPELFALIAAATDKPPITTFLPLWLAKLTAPLSELYYRAKHQPPLYTKYSLYTLESNSNFSHAKAEKALKFQPHPLKKTITDTVQWLERVGKI